MNVFIQILGKRLGVFRQAAEFLGISLWIAWVLLTYSGEFYFDETDVYRHTAFCYLMSTASISLVFFLAGLNTPRAEKAAFDNRIILFGGALGSAGTIGTMLCCHEAGLFSFAALSISAIATGIGTGTVALRGALAMGELSARNSFIVASATFIGSFILYLAILDLPYVSALTIDAILPLLAAFHLLFHRCDEAPAEYPEADASLTRPLWRMTIALFILAIVFSLSRGIYPNALEIAEFNDSRNYAAVGSMACGALLLTLSLVLPQGTPFGRLGYWIIIAIVFSSTLFPLLGLISVVSGVTSTVSNSTLGVTAWALFGAMSSLSRVSPLRVYGLGFSAFMFGSAVGWTGGFILQGKLFDIGQFTLGFAMLLVVFFVTFTLFRQNDLLQMTQLSNDDDEHPLGEPSSDRPANVANGTRLASPLLNGETKDNLESLHNETHRTSWKARMAFLARESGLTEREVEVFLLLAKGLNARAVSDALGFSYNTARVHVRNIYTKIDVHSRDELLEYVRFHDRRLKGLDPNTETPNS